MHDKNEILLLYNMGKQINIKFKNKEIIEF